MSNRDFNTREMTDAIFEDPVAYLARCGITAELVAETAMPAAA